MNGCCSGPPSIAPTAAAADQTYLAAALAISAAPESIRSRLRAALVRIPDGIFEMGARRSRFANDLDSPRRKVQVSPFLMSPVTVTNADFSLFVAATGYRTVAEREGWSFVFHLLLDRAADWPISPPGAPWWRKVDGCFWAQPEGPGSTLDGREDHPVVHIAWYDALAYCRWAGLRLPREAEWERAARGGLVNQRFPWGSAFQPGGRHAMNTFQGRFPDIDTGDDGWIGTGPVHAYAANGYGMFNMTGNVWEWVADLDGPRPARSLMPEVDPAGPADGHARIQRGGSYLCHDSYCDRYHVHSRTRCDPDSSAGNGGFRVAADLEPAAGAAPTIAT